MQRIPGVTLSRSDGGEGRNISVRGLGPAFTRVRINGMEGASQTGSSDIYGAGNNGRSFDFNVFPTEIFSSARGAQDAVGGCRRRFARRHGRSAGSASIRLRRGQRCSRHGTWHLQRGLRGCRSARLDARVEEVRRDTFGVLVSAAYQERHIREVGYSAVDILRRTPTPTTYIGTAPAPIFLPFCTPIGWTAHGPSPGHRQPRRDRRRLQHRTTRAPAISRRSTRSTTCGAPTLPTVPGSGAFLPRLPRYVNSEQDTERTGGTVTLQWLPSEDTSLVAGWLISRYQQERRDNYILGISTGPPDQQRRPAHGVGARRSASMTRARCRPRRSTAWTCAPKASSTSSRPRSSS